MIQHNLKMDAFKSRVSYPQLTREYFAQRMFPSGMLYYLSLATLAVGIFILLPAKILTVLAGGNFGIGLTEFLLIILPLILIFILFPSDYLRAAEGSCPERFARDNNFNYSPEIDVSEYTGMLFNRGGEQSYKDAISGTYQDIPFEFGNFTYVKMGKDSPKLDNGVLLIKLPRKLPHVVLDAKSNDNFGISSLPAALSVSQQFELEGDFGKYYTVYVPKDYERDALYFLTPDLMQALVDHAPGFDVEIVDDNLFLYFHEPFPLDESNTMLKMFDLITQVGGRLSDGAKRYANSRVGDGAAIKQAAEAGERLQSAALPKVLGAVLIGSIVLVVVDSWQEGEEGIWVSIPAAAVIILYFWIKMRS